MASDTGSTALEQRGLAPVTLVLICRGLERTMPGLRLDEVACRLSQRLEGVSMRVEEGLCHRPRVVKEALAGTHPQRLVLGLCSSDYPQAEVQAHARAADLNPLGIQAVDLASCSAGETAGPKAFACAVAVLTAAVARARAFPGSQPENTKTLLLTSRHKVSRRALFTLPPVSYLPVPTIDRGQCTTGEGCDQCVGACPSGALEKDGDAILVNRAACLSCGVCVAACPQRAVEFPGSSPAELEAQLSALLQADVEPKAVLFLCQHAPATPGPGWLTVRVPCTAAVPVAAILQALARGATAVGLS
ncbi:MAG: 4Fe-4S dicluster domain-containing protein, partial [Dehalococcoidia bacterium]